MNRRTVLVALALAAAPFGLQAQTAAVTPFTQAAFDAARAQGPVILHVHAAWCPTCRRQEPVLDRIAADPAFRGVRVMRVDFDAETAFRAANRIPGQATILVFKGGAEVARATGTVDPAQIRALADRAL